MSALPEPQIPQNTLRPSGQFPPPGQRSQSPQVQNARRPRTPPETRASLPCCGFSDIRVGILFFGVIHLLLQIAVTSMIRNRYVRLQKGSYSHPGNEYGGRSDPQLELERLAKQAQRVVDFLSEELYLAIVVYSSFNAAATILFLGVITAKGGKVACSVFYLFGVILTLIINGLYWRIVPSISDKTLEGRSIVFNLSVAFAVLYHICGFIFISSMLCEGRNGYQRTGLDLERGFPVEISPPTQNPSRVSPGFQQQSTTTPYTPTTSPIIE